MKLAWRREPDAVSASHFAYKVPYKVPHVASSLSQQTYDLRPFTSPRHNQGSSGSCVLNAVVKAFEIKRIQKYGRAAHVDLSRMAPYFLARELMVPSEVDHDDGTYFYLGCEVARRYGIPLESDWPFDLSKLFTPPSWRAMAKAYTHKLSGWQRMHSSGASRVEDVIASLAQGNPVIFGTLITDQWDGYDGKSPLRAATQATANGGHATTIVGWLPDYMGGVFVDENSWSNAWGDDGFCYLSPEVVSSPLSADFTVMYGNWETFPHAA